MNRFMLLLALVASYATAQTSMDYERDVVSQRASLRVMPVYQQWTLDAVSFSQASSVLTLYQPLSSDASIFLRGAYGAVSGGVTSLRGPTDIQLTGTYYLESADLIFNFGVGIPAGKRNLAFNEFVTSVLLTSNVLRPQIPHFGAGLTLSPSIAWALPLSDDVVIGLGAAFLYRGEFSPLAGFQNYDPSEEVSFTGGLDLQLDELSSLSGDVVFSLYGKDKIAGVDLLTPGSRVLASLQFQKLFEQDRLVLLLTFRSRGKSEFSNFLPQFAERAEPNQLEIFGAHIAKFSKRFAVQFFLEGRFFETTSMALTGFSLVGVGVAPEFTLSETISLPLQLKYVSGSSARDGKLHAVEAGIGLAVHY